MLNSFPGNLKFTMNNPMRGENVKALQSQLSKRGFLDPSKINATFDLHTERAVKSFQAAYNKKPTGLVHRLLWEHIFASDERNADRVRGLGNASMEPNEVKSSSNPDYLPYMEYDGSEKRTPYFNVNNTKELRKNDFEMKIDFGVNSSFNKTIKHLHPRSVGVELDASGQPIYEIYEFIAQDIVESDNEYKKEE